MTRVSLAVIGLSTAAYVPSRHTRPETVSARRLRRYLPSPHPSTASHVTNRAVRARLSAQPIWPSSRTTAAIRRGRLCS